MGKSGFFAGILGCFLVGFGGAGLLVGFGVRFGGVLLGFGVFVGVVVGFWWVLGGFFVVSAGFWVVLGGLLGWFLRRTCTGPK